MFSKFLKEILYKKWKLEDNQTVALSVECSALIRNKLSPKLKDPRSFSIPCEIGAMRFEIALCDIGVNVCLMPFSMCKRIKYR